MHLGEAAEAMVLWTHLGSEKRELIPGVGTAGDLRCKFASPQASLFFLCIFYRLLRKYACQKQSLGIFESKLQFSFCSELTVWQGCRSDAE